MHRILRSSLRHGRFQRNELRSGGVHGGEFRFGAFSSVFMITLVFAGYLLHDRRASGRYIGLFSALELKLGVWSGCLYGFSCME
jgi:hypothetical protein